MPVINNTEKHFPVHNLKSLIPILRKNGKLLIRNWLKQITTFYHPTEDGGVFRLFLKKYPEMSRFYNELLSNKNSDYKIIKEFVSYPNFKFQISNFKLMMIGLTNLLPFTIIESFNLQKCQEVIIGHFFKTKNKAEALSELFPLIIIFLSIWFYFIQKRNRK